METSLFATISRAFAEDGVWMYSIMVAQIVSIAIIVERIYALYLSRSPNQKKLIRGFEEDIRKGRLDSALSRAQSIGSSNPIGSVIQAGVQAAINMGGRDEIQAKMDEILLVENARLERRTGFLAMLGNVGTLLGLLGTTVGLIQSFASVANLSAAEKSIALTRGVSLAMNATAYGLIMAIPALIMYAVLQNRANVISEDLNQAAVKVFNWLSFNFEAVPQRPARRKTTM